MTGNGEGKTSLPCEECPRNFETVPFRISRISKRAWGPRGPVFLDKIRAFRNSAARSSKEGYALRYSLLLAEPQAGPGTGVAIGWNERGKRQQVEQRPGLPRGRYLQV